MLNVNQIEVFYGDVQVLWGVSFKVEEKELAALVGANGAGKSTTLMSIIRLPPPEGPTHRSGTIVFQGQDLTQVPAHRVVSGLGIALVPEGRRIFGNLTVWENIKIAAYSHNNPKRIEENARWIFQLFPRLEERRSQMGDTLSGGEQQMLAVARALMIRSKMMLLGELIAVNDVSFEVGNGEFFGFLGPNGAGKSTLIRMLTTLLKPTSGSAKVAGYDIVEDPDMVRRSIGVVPQAMSSDLDLTGQENMDIYGKFYEVPRKVRAQRIPELLEKVGLTKKAGDLVATYSGGMRRRLGIARVLVHRPAILFLDEPTSGLDPQSRRVVWEMLQGFRKDYELTIFLTTHYMDEAELLCERVAIIDHGDIITMGTPDELKKGLPGNDIVVLTLGDGAEKASEKASAEGYVHKTAVEGTDLRCYVDDGGRDASLLMQLMESIGINVRSVAIQKQTLEDVFIHHTGRSIREEDTRKVSMFLGAGVPQKWGR